MRCRAYASKLKDNLLARKKVILVSATPLNNRPTDIRNLIGLFHDLKDSTLETSNLQHFFARRQTDYDTALKNLTAEQARAEVRRIHEDIRLKVVQDITIRRTRTGHHPLGVLCQALTIFPATTTITP
jgi:hypothetical protein